MPVMSPLEQQKKPGQADSPALDAGPERSPIDAAEADPAAGMVVGSVNATVLNVRRGPSTGTPRVGQLKRGATVVSEAQQGEWLKVIHDGSPAWVHGGYVERFAASDRKVGSVEASVLNVRRGPSARTSVIGQLANGRAVVGHKRSGAWLQVVHNGQAGWVHSRYVDLDSAPKADAGSDAKPGPGADVKPKNDEEKDEVPTEDNAPKPTQEHTDPKPDTKPTTGATPPEVVAGQAGGQTDTKTDGKTDEEPGGAGGAGERLQVTATALNVRAEPGKGGAKVGTLREGDVIAVTEREGEWVAFMHHGEEAWVHGGFLEPEGTVSQRPSAGVHRTLYDKHNKQLKDTKLGTSHSGALSAFKKHWEAHQTRYERVGKEAGIPAQLVAAIHWREATGNFGTYLHQGDKLGRPARRVPKNIPVFHEWEPAAVHALSLMPDKARNKRKLKINSSTTDIASLAAYSELYNGTGYHSKGRTSPYVYAGTNQYSKGKYVKDGVYDANHRDRQAGIIAMLQTIAE